MIFPVNGVGDELDDWRPLEMSRTYGYVQHVQGDRLGFLYFQVLHDLTPLKAKRGYS